jgi:hypothetical protein
MSHKNETSMIFKGKLDEVQSQVEKHSEYMQNYFLENNFHTLKKINGKYQLRMKMERKKSKER